MKVMLGTTYRCQCDCVYCCSGKYPKTAENELSTDEIKSVIAQISSLPSLLTLISFFGGESLLRDDIYHLIKYANEKGLFTEIESNGICLSLENAKRLKKSGLHHVFIRIEGSTPDTHDLLSNYKGCFNKAIEAIVNCKKNKLSCSISTIAIRDKIYNNELKEVIKLGESLGVASVRILFPTRSGNWLNKENETLIAAEERLVRELLRPDFVYLESTHVSSKEAERICPSAQKKLFYISPYGEIQLCPFVPLKFGNLRYKKLKDILLSVWGQPFFNIIENDGCPMNNKKFRDAYI